MSCSVTVAAGFSKVCPSVNGGRVFSVSLSASSVSGLFFKAALYFRSISFQPSQRMVLPLTVKGCPAHSKTAVTASKVCGAAVAMIRRAPARVRMFLSLSGSAERSDFASSIVGIMAWWSDTFLLFRTFPSSGVKSFPAIKENFPQSSLIMPAAVSLMSSVRNALSVLG